MSRRVEYEPNVGWVPTDEETAAYAEELSKWLKKSIVDDVLSEVEKTCNVEITDELRQWIDENCDKIQHGLERIEGEDMSDFDKIISHPDHYCEGRKYEPKDVIYDWGLDFNLGSAVKYLSRAGRKENNSKEQDLKKAIQYIQFELEADRKRDKDD